MPLKNPDNNSKSRVIIITGTPGTGKTTVSKLLSKKLKGIYINVGNIVRNRYFLGLDIKRNSLIADIDKLQQFVDNILVKIRKLSVIDSILPDIVSSENVLLVVVLHTAIEELYDRLSMKGFEVKKIMENIDAELCKICYQDAIETYGLEHVFEIDTTDSDPNKTVEHIYKEIRNRFSIIA
ncbi:MAG: AAA family ATPase [Promethearchaeota archaeon]